MGIQALIKDSKVINIIVASDRFTPSEEYDIMINITDFEKTPNIGWLYNKEDGVFIPSTN